MLPPPEKVCQEPFDRWKQSAWWISRVETSANRVISGQFLMAPGREDFAAGTRLPSAANMPRSA